MAEPKLKLNDQDFLSKVFEERKRAIGLANDAELSGQRIRALEYFKGVMRDVPSLPNRSKATDSSVADSINTVMPDLLEVFTGGDDVATFAPTGPEDEEAAQQETDYVNHVLFNENNGFMILASLLQDALLSKIGVATWWWEEYERPQEEPFEGLSLTQIEYEKQNDPDTEAEDMEEGGQDPFTGEPLYKGTWKWIDKGGCAKVDTVPPEDFAIAQDARRVSTSTYSCYATRPRAQDLIAQGYDADIVKSLPPYGTRRDDGSEQARDTVNETDQQRYSSDDDLRQVEITAHFIRIDADGDGKPEIWRVVTGADESVLLEKKKVSNVQVAVLTPFLVTHRVYGRSLADMMLEVQRIKTALLRMLLDSGYFALNQRLEMSEAAASENTLADILRNEPGVPIRSKTGEAVRPVSAGALSFDVMGALEYAATIGEQRSGVVRNAQGLNPDTLHDTAQGAMALIGAAQKRVRMIARVFAETGLKDLFIGLHTLLREHGGKAATVRLRNKWVEVDPTQWGERNDMTIHVGVGSGGKEHDLMVANQRLQLAQELATQQGGLSGPMLTPSNVHAMLEDWERAAGSKKGDQYWTDPASAPPQPPKPDPEMMKAQAELQLKQQTAQSDMQLRQSQASADMDLRRSQAQADAASDAAKAQADILAQREKMAGDIQLQREKMGLEHQQKMTQLSQEIELERERLAAELAIKRETAMAQVHMSHEVGMAKVNASVDRVQPGGEPG